jgi:polyisoprenoid-binding protein YceI
MLAKARWKFPALLVAAALLVAGCPVPPARAPAPAPGPAPGPGPGSGSAATVGQGSPAIPAPPSPPRGLPTYRIDPAQSELRVLVHRAGTLAKLGHDHVIENHALTGWVGLAPRAADTSFYVQIPVAQFVVDDAAARAAAGPEFAEEVGGDAKEGTRRNMLGPALLDAGNYAAIAVRSVTVRGEGPNLDATVAIDVAGHGATLTIPIVVTRAERELTASADFSVRQTELGLTPFSVMGGALRVADEIKLRLRLVARAE